MIIRPAFLELANDPDRCKKKKKENGDRAAEGQKGEERTGSNGSPRGDRPRGIEQRHARSAPSGVDGETNRARGPRERRPPPRRPPRIPTLPANRVIPLSRLVIHPITSLRHPRQPARF